MCIHILDHHLISSGTLGISSVWLQLFPYRSGYPATAIPKALTKGTAPHRDDTQGGVRRSDSSLPLQHVPKNQQQQAFCKEAQQRVVFNLKPAHRKQVI